MTQNCKCRVKGKWKRHCSRVSGLPRCKRLRLAVKEMRLWSKDPPLPGGWPPWQHMQSQWAVSVGSPSPACCQSWACCWALSNCQASPGVLPFDWQPPISLFHSSTQPHHDSFSRLAFASSCLAFTHSHPLTATHHIYIFSLPLHHSRSNTSSKMAELRRKLVIVGDGACGKTCLLM